MQTIILESTAGLFHIKSQKIFPNLFRGRPSQDVGCCDTETCKVNQLDLTSCDDARYEEAIEHVIHMFIHVITWPHIFFLFFL